MDSEMDRYVRKIGGESTGVHYTFFSTFAGCLKIFIRKYWQKTLSSLPIFVTASRNLQWEGRERQCVWCLFVQSYTFLVLASALVGLTKVRGERRNQRFLLNRSIASGIPFWVQVHSCQPFFRGPICGFHRYVPSRNLWQQFTNLGNTFSGWLLTTSQPPTSDGMVQPLPNEIDLPLVGSFWGQSF